MKYRMLIKMDSEVFVAASLLWVGLIVSHHKTSDTLRLALYQLINVNWQNYEQEIMPQSQLFKTKLNNMSSYLLSGDLERTTG